MNVITRLLILILVSNISIKSLYAGEGMWIPLLLKALNEAEMQQMGMKMTAEDIYSVNKGSLKDAIVHFNGSCTSEIISAKGLLLTNHHCGYSQIQSHTTLENNYLKNGFWAKNMEQELPNENLKATLIARIEDVSKSVLQGVSEKMSESERQSAIDKNIDQLIKATEHEEYEDIMVRPFFDGNQYFLFVTVTYTDIRLVGTPPDAIGKFGADTDNWVWPRHTGDFSLFRIYAGKDNLPAAYSKDNIPFTPKHFLPISLDGIEEGDFTLVFGFPGRTTEYLPSYAVEQIVDVLDPAKIAIRERALEIMNAAMRADEQVRIQYASKQARIANYWKKWVGEVQGLKSTNGVAHKQAFEKEFTTAIKKKKSWTAAYGKILPEFKRLYKDIEPYAFATDYFNEVINRNVELMGVAGQMMRLVNIYENSGDKGYNDYVQRLQNHYKKFYKDYQKPLDQKIFAALSQMYMENVNAVYVPDYARAQLRSAGKNFGQLAHNVYSNSSFGSEAEMLKLFEMEPAQAIAKIQTDPAYLFASHMRDIYNDKILKQHNELKDQIDKLQRTYMAALLEVFPDRRFYPDANGTLRATYGKVSSYEPRDAVKYLPQTYLSGVIAKYQPGDYEFDVPEKLIELYETKDYGKYGENGKMPVCFIGSNHTTGGNSGSPAIDAHGNLIGLNFDRVWEGTMSDIYYDASICRNIMVDIRYVLFIIDKFAGAGHLVDEMKLVNPKKNQQKEVLEAPKYKRNEKIKKPVNE